MDGSVHYAGEFGGEETGAVYYYICFLAGGVEGGGG